MYYLHIIYLLSVEGFLRGQERVHFCCCVLICLLLGFFLKKAYSVQFNYFKISCLLYEKNLYTSVYTAKGKKTLPHKFCVDLSL